MLRLLKEQEVYASRMELERASREIDKGQVDASPPGDITVSLHSSARCSQPNAVAESLWELVGLMESEHALLLKPLRLILVTAGIGDAVNHWNRALGLPESGVSQHPEGVVAGKHMSWGESAESARSIIILPDYIAVAVAANDSTARATVIHELGHVHDDFARGSATGFRQAQPPPRLNDWPRLCTYIAEEMTWSEYAAESIAAGYWAPNAMKSFAAHNSLYLAGVHSRLRRLVLNYNVGQLDLSSLWSRAVTDLSDLFAHLGRAAAHVGLAENHGAALDCAVNPGGEEACWKPVVERLLHELQALGAKSYSEWGGAPFCGLEDAIALGFEAAGFIPTYNDNNLHLKVS